MKLGTVPGVRDYLRQKRDEINRREIAAKFDGVVHNCCKVSDKRKWSLPCERQAERYGNAFVKYV